MYPLLISSVIDHDCRAESRHVYILQSYRLPGRITAFCITDKMLAVLVDCRSSPGPVLYGTIRHFTIRNATIASGMSVRDLVGRLYTAGVRDLLFHPHCAGDAGA